MEKMALRNEIRALQSIGRNGCIYSNGTPGEIIPFCVIASCRVNCALICIPVNGKSMEPEIPATTGMLMNAVRD
ncbi:hypothetical protein [Escherichia coli]|uniref:hypothetical protein n=1 Tax=Escherichia coli TaxID=562 RepID=UPI002FCD14D9